MRFFLFIMLASTLLFPATSKANDVQDFVGDFLDECIGESKLSRMFDDHVGLGSWGTLRDAYVPNKLFQETVEIEVYDDYAVWTWSFVENVNLSSIKLHSARLIAGFENGIHSRALIFNERRQQVEQTFFDRIQRANEKFRDSDTFKDLGIPWFYVSEAMGMTAIECDLNT